MARRFRRYLSSRHATRELDFPRSDGEADVMAFDLPDLGPLSRPKRQPWRELSTLRELAQLRRLRRDELPRGNSTVLVLPGFQTGDATTWVLRRALASAGHRPRGWGLGINRGNLGFLLPRLVKDVEREPRPIALVGWSLGGFIAREIAREVPAKVLRVITLASPVVGGPKYTAAAHSYEKRGLNMDAIERKVAERDSTHPLTVPVTALYSRSDAIVCPAACIDRVNAQVEHIEIDCAHLAFGFNRRAIRIIAERLAMDTA